MKWLIRSTAAISQNEDGNVDVNERDDVGLFDVTVISVQEVINHFECTSAWSLLWKQERDDFSQARESWEMTCVQTCHK